MRALLLVVLLPTSSCTAERDLDIICDVYTRALVDTSNKDARATRMANELHRRLRNPEVIALFSAVASVSADEKYAFFKVGAAELGHPAWQCPAMERFWAQPQP